MTMPWVQVKGITDAGLKPRAIYKIAVLSSSLGAWVCRS